MPEGLQSSPRDAGQPPDGPEADVIVCRSCPGRFVFIESGNSNGWIATDTAVERTR